MSPAPLRSRLYWRLLRSRLHFHFRLSYRQEYPKRTSVAQLALDIDRAPMAAHDSRNGCQPQSASGELGGEERIEYTGYGASIHAGAGIAHFEAHISTSLQVTESGLLIDRLHASPYPDHPRLVTDRLGAVHNQIQDQLPDLRRIGLDGQELARQVEFQSHIGWNGCPEEIAARADFGG